MNIVMNGLTVVILAAGEGKRMRSRQPKVLHPLCGRPLIAYPLRAAHALADRFVVVAPPETPSLRQALEDEVRIVEQRDRLGTGHAVLQAKQECGDGTILVLPGDMPLISAETLERLVAHHRATGAAATMLTAIVERPQGYGRVLRQGGRVKRVVEDRDATDDEKKVAEINTSVYCFEADRLWATLAEVKPDNDQGEYYLTDVIGILNRRGARVEGLPVSDAREALGVNDRKQLATAATVQRGRILDRLMESGVTVLDPATTYIEDTVTVGTDTVIYPHVVIEGASVVGSECVVGAGCHLTRATMADRVTLKPYCILVDSVVDEDAILGPFCHLRPQSHVGAGAHIGNFVELKKTRLGKGSKANHLAYLGDATIGDGVNVGAGVITCNYDGLNKHPTTIQDEAFIGTNASLVAPITIGAQAYIGAGSTVTRDVPAGALVVERSAAVVKDGWGARRSAQRAAKKKKG
jgi:bifunctional UDP-N-acetylglucosamine pyrophosphorylase / glucosamine-1-phosphate N-acetyltransferase